MNKIEFAEKAINSGVVLPLMQLLRGKITWVEQRVAVRALGHLASHERAFEAIANEFEVEIVELAIELASNCSKTIYKKFLGVKDRKRLKYHCDLLTRGIGGEERENRKAEEWANQLQCWSLYLLNCFACKERSVSIICKKQQFLKDLCGLWGGLGNRKSPGGVGLIRSLCNTTIGRESIANIEEVIVGLCNKSRTCDYWRYMAIDSLLLLLKDTNTRYKVIEIAASFLADLVELKSLKEKDKIGETITQTLLQDYYKIKYGGLKLKNQIAEDALKEIWELKVERRKKEEIISNKEMKERKNLAQIFKRKGNKKFWSGFVEKAVVKYTKALDLCPLKMRKERIVLYSNRAQCYLLLKIPEAAIRDTTRALSLCDGKSLHRKSLWRRSQAYDMKGMAKESLMDCLMFINVNVKIPYYAARMINKQMNATWIFAEAKSKRKAEKRADKSNGEDKVKMMMKIKEKKGLPTVQEESLGERERSKQQGTAKRRREAAGLTAALARVRIV
ncbi:hypothetical protein JCGZ_12494 [Jatropha curcas]|uniref:ARM repeat N-terminal plant domain-containing protein n=2 Tax=Jatropha curcas TaxID=180498 RepID=A0A067KAI6_JATCU|nr:hypothetical protein JCGZ_12494 [Jatropha curcas]